MITELLVIYLGVIMIWLCLKKNLYLSIIHIKMHICIYMDTYEGMKLYIYDLLQNNTRHGVIDEKDRE